MRLRRHQGSTDGWATLHVKSFPFIVGDSPDDCSWECECGAVLATGLYSRQVLDLLIQCGRCSNLLESPRRRPGQPIAGRPVYAPPGGTYLIGGQLDVIGKPVMMVGHGALCSYAMEVGKTIPDVYTPTPSAILQGLDADSFRAAASGLEDLLGDDLGRLKAADTRGRQSHTPPESRHRLIELAEFAEETAQVVDRGGTINLDGNLLAEAVTVLAVVNRWRNHPAWSTLRRALVSEAEHTVMLLTIASYLVDANNGVGVHFTPGKQDVAIADMWIEPDLSQRVDLEVKTPLALRGPKNPISQPHAITVLERALKKSSRQRSNTRTSILVVGGYHMGASYQTMVTTAKAMLALERRKWRGLAGIVIADCTYEDKLEGGVRSFSPIARVDIAQHPGHQGQLSVQSDPVPTSSLPATVRTS